MFSSSFLEIRIALIVGRAAIGDTQILDFACDTNHIVLSHVTDRGGKKPDRLCIERAEIALYDFDGFLAHCLSLPDREGSSMRPSPRTVPI